MMPLNIPRLARVPRSVSPEDADGIIRAAAYHRRDYDLAVIWFSPADYQDVRASIQTSTAQTSSTGLGKLPYELVSAILHELDLVSLFRMRHVSKPFKAAVHSLFEYKIAVPHGFDAFRALLVTRLARHYTLKTFYDLLCQEKCSLCGLFGGFLFLPTRLRCCFQCLNKAQETRVDTVASIMQELGDTMGKEAQRWKFRRIPGKYTMNECQYDHRISLAPIFPPAPLLGDTATQQLQQLLRPPAWSPAKFRFMACCRLPFYDRQRGTTEDGVSCAGCQLDLQQKMLSCRFGHPASALRDRVYSRAGFLDHFQSCESAQMLWESSERGTIEPLELPEWVRREGYFSNRE